MTYSRMLLPIDASTADWPTDCNTVQINPIAMSSREASLLALPNNEATADMGKPGNGRALMSHMRRLIFDTLPCIAISETVRISSVLSNKRDNP